MITYLAHSHTLSLEDIVVYKYENNSLLLTESLNFKDLAAFVTDQSQFIFLLSSSDVSSYSIDGDNENNPEATFVSGVEDSIVEDVSDISVKTSATNAFLVIGL